MISTIEKEVNSADEHDFYQLELIDISEHRWSGLYRPKEEFKVRITELEKSSHIPRELFISKDLLLSLNHDSSVTVWDRYNQKILLEFYLFDDLSWIALFQNTDEYLSYNAEDYIIRD